MPKGGNHAAPGELPGAPFQEGEDPRRGHGVKGRSGPYHKDIRGWSVSAVRKRNKRTRFNAIEALHQIATDPEHQQCVAANKLLFAYGWGQPKASIQIEGELPVLRIVKDQAAVQQAVNAGRVADDE